MLSYISGLVQFNKFTFKCSFLLIILEIVFVKNIKFVIPYLSNQTTIG